MGIDIEPVPLTGLAANFSPMPRMAPPPLGKTIAGAEIGKAPCPGPDRADPDRIEPSPSAMEPSPSAYVREVCPRIQVASTRRPASRDYLRCVTPEAGSMHDLLHVFSGHWARALDEVGVTSVFRRFSSEARRIADHDPSQDSVSMTSLVTRIC